MMNGTSNPFGPPVGGGTPFDPPSQQQQPPGQSPAYTNPYSPSFAHPPPVATEAPYYGGAAQPYNSAPPANPYGSPPPYSQSSSQQAQNGGALVVSATQSNPYATPYGMPPPTPSPLGGSSQYDPFLSTPPAPMLQSPPQEPPREIQTYTKTEDPPGMNGNTQVDPPAFQPAVDTLAPPPGTTYPPQHEYGQKTAPSSPTTSEERAARNKYSEQLARQAPPGASALPRADIVGKKGYVLSRISFRTIVMKKWKQSFWVQYGPHTMLWFRSEADFDDWLNNPYHMQGERNYLIKLAVNFVHDLYKPNVRGYQVTQCRTKAYGNKMVRQFKLERWMDYGPTIAAAFGSYDPAEVDALREAVVECMRNTPLNNGIRATGAVRQRPQQEEEPQRPSRQSSYEELPKDAPQVAAAARKETESVAEETDLLDLNNWDDVPTESPSVTGPALPAQQYASPTFAPPPSHGAPSHGPPPPSHGPPSHGPPSHGPPSSNALVLSNAPASPWALQQQYPPQPSTQYPPQPSPQYPQQQHYPPQQQFPPQQQQQQQYPPQQQQFPPLQQEQQPQFPPPPQQQYPPQQPTPQQGYSTNPWGM